MSGPLILIKIKVVNFDYSHFGTDDYSFFSSYEVAVGKNVRRQLKETCCLPAISYSSALPC